MDWCDEQVRSLRANATVVTFKLQKGGNGVAALTSVNRLLQPRKQCWNPRAAATPRHLTCAVAARQNGTCCTQHNKMLHVAYNKATCYGLKGNMMMMMLAYNITKHPLSKRCSLQYIKYCSVVTAVAMQQQPTATRLLPDYSSSSTSTRCSLNATRPKHVHW